MSHVPSPDPENNPKTLRRAGLAVRQSPPKRTCSRTSHATSTKPWRRPLFRSRNRRKMARPKRFRTPAAAFGGQLGPPERATSKFARRRQNRSVKQQIGLDYGVLGIVAPRRRRRQQRHANEIAIRSDCEGVLNAVCADGANVRNWARCRPVNPILTMSAFKRIGCSSKRQPWPQIRHSPLDE